MPDDRVTREGIDRTRESAFHSDATVEVIAKNVIEKQKKILLTIDTTIDPRK